MSITLPRLPYDNITPTTGNFSGQQMRALSYGMSTGNIHTVHQPEAMQHILLPLLQQLALQSRWQLWLTPQRRLSTQWLQQSGLPLSKVMQISRQVPCLTVAMMIKALQTGNYSAVVGCITEDVTDSQRQQLELAAATGNALGIILSTDKNDGLPGVSFHDKISVTSYH
ncbi:MAG: Cell division inhibitor SulA [Candidatus Erwinia impunctatus]|nr:Cell division inhibitor SulA [Culicoides impunctatus]